jgi:Ser/Thr protein kinase RdoA (MazF antagonist)
MTQTECQQLADYWDIGSIQSIDIPETGTINTIRILTTDTGKFVLRVYQHHIRQRIETEHRVVAWVAEKGIPAVVPIRTRDGKDFVEDKGQFVTLLPFVSGKQISRDQLQTADIDVMGRFLGRLHRVLQAFPTEDMSRVWIKIEPTGTLAGIDRLEGVVRAIEKPQLTDEYALTRLISRRDWLQGRMSEDATGFFKLSFQAVHGDYQETNLFFENGEVSAMALLHKEFKC